MFISSWFRNNPTGCTAPSARPIGASLAASTFAKAGVGTCGRNVSSHSYPISRTSWRQHGISRTNPVRAGLCADAEDWPWSSGRAHLKGEDDLLVRVAPMLELVPNWRDYLREPRDTSIAEHIHSHVRAGRPPGSDAFVIKLEDRRQRTLQPQKRGPKPKPKVGTQPDPFSGPDFNDNKLDGLRDCRDWSEVKCTVPGIPGRLSS